MSLSSSTKKKWSAQVDVRLSAFSAGKKRFSPFLYFVLLQIDANEERAGFVIPCIGRRNRSAAVAIADCSEEGIVATTCRCYFVVFVVRWRVTHTSCSFVCAIFSYTTNLSVEKRAITSIISKEKEIHH